MQLKAVLYQTQRPGDMAKKSTTRILVIGEDSTITDLLRLTLRPELFEIYSAESMEIGFEAAQKSPPHLVIFDLILNGNEGLPPWALFRDSCKAPILVLSAIQNPGMVAKVLDSGADGFLTKPVPNEILVANINNLTRRARFEREASTTK
jgi:DNA-binding response OmpR family regulator